MARQITGGTAKIDETNVPLPRSIAAKIFGLAVFVLFMTIALTCFLLFEVSRIEHAIRIVSRHDIPLAQAISHIDYTALQRQLAFERWFSALDAAAADTRAAEDAAAHYNKLATQLREEALALQKRLESYPATDAVPPQMLEVKLLFDQLISIYPVMTRQMMAALEAQKAGERQKATEQISLILDLQNSVQATREKMDERMSALAMASAELVAKQQRYTLWIAIAATASTLLLGLLVAWIIASNLTRPIRALVQAMGKVRHGQLDIDKLPVAAHDEVGQLTDTFNYFVEELRAKEMIKRTFGKYVDPRVLEHVLSQPGQGAEEVTRRIMTVSFADIVGFTTLSERLTPSAMVAVLNRHFELQAQIIHEHQGIVDKFMGDAVMAFWGPPFVAAEEHAVLACRSALAQIAIVEQLNREIPEITGLRKDMPRVELRAGICTGDMVVGNIGAESSRSFTVIGDSVNLASRLEGANRVYGTRILIGENTRNTIGSAFATREIDMIAVKGKEEPTRIYELLGETTAVPLEQLQLRDRYASALAAYRAQDWDAAEQGFRACLMACAGDVASQRFIERIASLRQMPPAPDWNGVWQLTSK